MGVLQAIEIMKRAGMEPTRRRVAVAAVALAGDGQLPATPEELEDRALDAGLCLTGTAAAEALAELRLAGVLPADGAGDPVRADNGAQILQAMGNRHRYAVLRELLKGERCVGELQNVVGIQQSALSQHLARLRADGLVTTRRDAIRIFYSLADSRVAAILRLF